MPSPIRRHDYLAVTVYTYESKGNIGSACAESAGPGRRILITSICRVHTVLSGKSKDYRLTEEAKARLLHLSMEGEQPEIDNPTDNSQKQDMLYDIMISSLPKGESVSDLLPCFLKGVCGRLPLVAGESFEKILQDPKADLSKIERIKIYAKQKGLAAGSEVEKEVLLAVYFAAIASAIGFQNKKITQHTTENLQCYFQSYLDEDWLLDEMKDIFQRGLSVLQEQAEPDTQEDMMPN